MSTQAVGSESMRSRAGRSAEGLEVTGVAAPGGDEEGAPLHRERRLWGVGGLTVIQSSHYLMVAGSRFLVVLISAHLFVLPPPTPPSNPML